MLFHPGCKPQRPVGPVTLLTLATSSEDPSNEQQQRAAVGCSKTLLGVGRATVPSGSQQLDAAQISPQQPSPGNEELQAKSSGEGLKPDSAAGHGPNSTQEEVRRGAAAESLVVLVWVHPAAAKEAWATLKELTQGLGISCTSRSADTDNSRLEQSAFTLQELFCFFLVSCLCSCWCVHSCTRVNNKSYTTAVLPLAHTCLRSAGQLVRLQSCSVSAA